MKALVTLPVPTPADPDRELLALWHRHVAAHSRDGHGDAEDWTEAAVRLRIAVTHGFDLVERDDEVALDEPFFGPVLRHGPFASLASCVDRYAFSPTFQQHCGRDLVFARGGLDSLRQAAARIFEAGAERVRFKDPHQAKTYLGVWSRGEGIPAELGWGAVHREGKDNAFMLHAEVPMTFEYRVFVIAGQPVTGAGCVESRTPLDNSALFDPVVENLRRDGRIVRRPDLVETVYRPFAEEVCAQFASEGLTTYVLDLAMVGDSPAIIELNEIHNAGLYALDELALGEAIAANVAEFRYGTGGSA